MGMQMMLLGGAGLFYTAVNGSALSDAVPGNLATASLDIARDGTFTFSGTDSGTVVGDWVTPKTASSGDTHWVRATVVSGTVTTGTTGSWQQLSATRSWTKSATTGNASVTLTIEIATDSGGVNIVSSGTAILSYQHTL